MGRNVVSNKRKREGRRVQRDNKSKDTNFMRVVTLLTIFNFVLKLVVIREGVGTRKRKY